MTTLAYCAVSPDGCGTPNELILTPEAARSARFAEAVPPRARPCRPSSATPARSPPAPAARPGALAGVQPAGDAAHQGGDRRPDQAHHRRLRAGARLLADAGFDAVELHFGHGYLPSEFLSPGSTSAPTTGAARSRTGPASCARSPRGARGGGRQGRRAGQAQHGRRRAWRLVARRERARGAACSRTTAPSTPSS